MTPTILTLALAIGAPALKDKPNPQDLHGEWEFDKPEAPGTPGAGEFYRYRFNKDGTWQVFRGDKEMAPRRNFKFDPDARPPTIDFSTPPARDNSPTLLGIYKIEGDRLTICSGYPADPRPGDFTTGPGGGRSVKLLRRVKPPD